MRGTRRWICTLGLTLVLGIAANIGAAREEIALLGSLGRPTDLGRLPDAWQPLFFKAIAMRTGHAVVRFCGQRPPRIAGAARMTDTDNSGESAVVPYDQIALRPAR
jgi:hypothetical protein